MKTFLVATFFGITHAFSKNTEFTYKRSSLDSLLDSLNSSLDSLSKEKILVLILEQSAINDQCEIKLKEYCNDLKSINIKPKDLYPILEELCEERKGKQKCTDLKDKITTISNKVKDSLDNINNNIENLKFYLEKKHCNYVHFQCMFFRKFSGFSIVCDNILEQCYEKISKNLTYEVLLRALDGNLKDKTACETKIKDSCQKLNMENFYLIWFCFQKERTCNVLIENAKYNCESLKKNIKNTLENNYKLKEKCYFLLQECYFYSSNCEKEDKQECMKLKSFCEEKNIIYPHSHSFSFNPMISFTLQEKIGLQQLYSEALAFGVFLGKSLLTSLSRFLVFSNYYGKNNAEKLNNFQKCINSLKNCTFKYLTEDLKSICNTVSHDETCRKLNNELQEECRSLKLYLYNNKLSSVNNNTESNSYSWDQLPETISQEDCINFSTKCYYISSYCSNALLNACQNLKRGCSKSAFYKLAYGILEEGLFGLFHNLNSNRLKKCTDKLVEKCQTLRNRSIYLLSLCLKPKETCKALAKDVEKKSHRLQHILDEKRDYPQEQDCLVLEKKCKDLTKDFNQLNAPCNTLKKHCDHLRNTKKLKGALLIKNKDILVNVDNCTEYLNIKCSQWFRREINPFNLTCVAHRKSCVIMTEDVQNHCSAFQQNMEDHKVIEKSKEDEERDDICFLWEEYCDMLMENCPHKLKHDNNGGNGPCMKLKNNCKTFREKKPLLKVLMYNMKGSLTRKDICVNQLNNYCRNSMKSNKTLKNLCQKYNKDEKTRNKICDKFIKWVKILCDTLPIKLDKAVEDLKNRANEFKKAKQETEKAVNDSGLFLLISQAINEKQNYYRFNTRSNIHNNVTAYIKLMRREDVLDTHPSVRQGLAFDLISLVIELYLEAKAICDHSIQECVFENDCLKFKDSCKEIDKYCKEFELPEAISLVITSISTVTITDSLKDTQSESTIIKITDGSCVLLHSKTSWITSKSLSTEMKTSTSLITSTQKCKPVPCTTEKAQTKVPEDGNRTDRILIPSEGIKISKLTIVNIVIWAMSIFIMI
ncbi:uncharacterized protein T551_02056 [Pneumocystis jirovecii RU7]|uniref:Major surface glycoprotein 2 C-terminal domain-containing protein n=1 Tax=Pneumocystis jirovecii (strain RU7) TaxID=1408657 RepID=A0A0W4ZM56_PNEJ7|nr:uncharacterized protein T551_02056 [Pneumocystis jirovecii RU7]KTW29440.1 hypothetical protein T551_02056 [Pneumocystis jirovecii RU7]